MNERVLTAILLKARDSSENDKLVRLFTLDEGVITAVMKGVKKTNAKLKFGAQPFAFCEYSLATGKGGFHTVTNCRQIEDFFAITCDYEKFTAGSLLLECADIAAGSGKNEHLFILLLKAVKEVIYGGKFTLKEICCLFIERILNSGGYAEIKEVYSDASKRFGFDIKAFENAFGVKLKSAPLIC